jgi:crotonobetainyl-CoA:carnitine CoA-transferase CaiB-like acyl-CoA transferase
VATPSSIETAGLERSGLFLYLNTSKRSITLDLQQASGVAIFRRLVPETDVIIESFKPGTMALLGLDYEALESIDARLIVTSISDFGRDGPYRDYTTSDLEALALGGLLYITGDGSREPLQMGGAPAQYFAGLSAFTGTLMAVYHQEATGLGQLVDVSVLEGIAVAQMYSALNFAYRKENRGRVQDFSPMFKAKDGHVGLMYRPQNWEDFCHLMGRPDLVADPRFAEAAARRRNMPELNAIVAEWVKTQPKTELYHSAQALRMPFGYISNAKDLLESSQYEHRGYFVEIDHPATGPLIYPGLPFRMGDMCGNLRGASARRANVEVYCEQLGYSKEDLSASCP